MSASSPPSTLKFASVESQYIVLICETASRLFLRGIPEAVIRKLAGLELLARERATDTSPSECLELSVEVIEKLAGTTGLEPATSDVTGRRSNQLNYVPIEV
jgi:hypothetical protein